uniref:Uncharacterized protein n=1 Tax=Rhizophora mucronata TaxID=61149 RepID=A0A2P2Q5M5_RHIMU
MKYGIHKVSYRRDIKGPLATFNELTATLHKSN